MYILHEIYLQEFFYKINLWYKYIYRKKINKLIFEL